MEELEKYKQEVIASMLSVVDASGVPVLTEKEALEILNDLGDAPLIDGMLFNTPEETAQFLMET